MLKSGKPNATAGSVVKIGETTDFVVAGGTKIVRRYTGPQLKKMDAQLVIVKTGTQIEMRKAESAALAQFKAKFGEFPKYNDAAKKGKGLR